MRVDFTVESRAVILKSRSVSLDLEDILSDAQLEEIWEMDEDEVQDYLHGELFGVDLAGFCLDGVAEAVKDTDPDDEDVEDEDVTDVTVDWTDGPWCVEMTRYDLLKRLVDEAYQDASQAELERVYCEVMEEKYGDMDDEDLNDEAEKYGIVDCGEKIKII